MSINTKLHNIDTDRQTGRHTDTHRQTDKHRQIDRQTDRHTQVDRYRQPDTDKQTDRHRYTLKPVLYISPYLVDKIKHFNSFTHDSNTSLQLGF